MKNKKKCKKNKLTNREQEAAETLMMFRNDPSLFYDPKKNFKNHKQEEKCSGNEVDEKPYISDFDFVDFDIEDINKLSKNEQKKIYNDTKCKLTVDTNGFLQIKNIFNENPEKNFLSLSNIKNLSSNKNKNNFSEVHASKTINFKQESSKIKFQQTETLEKKSADLLLNDKIKIKNILPDNDLGLATKKGNQNMRIGIMPCDSSSHANDFLIKKTNIERDINNNTSETFQIKNQLSKKNSLNYLSNKIIGLINDFNEKPYMKLSNSENKQLKKLVEDINGTYIKDPAVEKNNNEPIDKKLKHLESEHKRRNAINIGIQTLSEIVPNIRTKSKKLVVYNTVSYILELRKELAELKEEKRLNKQ